MQLLIIVNASFCLCLIGIVAFLLWQQERAAARPLSGWVIPAVVYQCIVAFFTVAAVSVTVEWMRAVAVVMLLGADAYMIRVIYHAVRYDSQCRKE